MSAAAPFFLLIVFVEQDRSGEDRQPADGGGDGRNLMIQKETQHCGKKRGHEHIVGDFRCFFRFGKGDGPGDIGNGGSEDPQKDHVKLHQPGGGAELSEGSGRGRSKFDAAENDADGRDGEGGILFGEPALEDVINAQHDGAEQQPEHAFIKGEGAPHQEQDQNAAEFDEQGKPLDLLQTFPEDDGSQDPGEDRCAGDGHGGSGRVHHGGAVVEHQHVHAEAEGGSHQ